MRCSSATTSRRRARGAAALAAALAVVAAGCGGGGDDPGEAAGGEAGEPTHGGTIVYGLEAETTDGWCLPEAQLAISGIQVARSVYDTLTVPDADADYVPYLAESVTPNETHDSWTVTLRDGVTFHDGSALDATVVKNNLDAYRNLYPPRTSLLLSIMLEPVAEVDVVDDLTLTITTSQPWPALPAYLYSSGRLGIMGQAQLDDPDTCDTELIGTGPFMLEEWRVNERVVLSRNPDYWYSDPATGAQLPYLDGIEFRPIPESQSRVNSFQSDELDAMHTSEASSVQTLRQESEAGDAVLVDSDEHPEVVYVLLNTSVPPFDNIHARRALAYALDREQYREVINQGLFELASGPFGPGNVGHLDDAGYPEADLDEARRHVQRYEDETGEPLEFELTGGPTPAASAMAQFTQKQVEAAGMEMGIDQIEQSAMITTTVAGDYQAMTFRNHPGGHPDEQYIWWRSGSPINFGRIDDPEIDRLLEEGRREADLDEATRIYEDVNRRFSDQLYALWMNWVQWNVAMQPGTGGVTGPQLPDGSDPFPGLATGHPVTGLYVQDP